MIMRAWRSRAASLFAFIFVSCALYDPSTNNLAELALLGLPGAGLCGQNPLAIIQPGSAADFQRYLQTQANRGTNTATVTTLGSVSAGGSQWIGGVAAQDGSVYGVPGTIQTILRIDPAAGLTQISAITGSGLNNAYNGAVLHPNGKIYAIPETATTSSTSTMMEFDPLTGIVNFPGPDFDSSIFDKWAGAIVAPNGKIYGIPHSSGKVLIYDLATAQTSFITSSILNCGGQCWYGGVLGFDGMIYAIPRTQGTSPTLQILQINPNTDTIALVGPDLSGTCTNDCWGQAAIAPNGRIYILPHFATVALEFDPVTMGVVMFGTLPGGVLQFSGAVLAPNGHIYGIPTDSPQVLDIDTNVRNAALIAFTHFGLGGTHICPSQHCWDGGVLATNGHIYGIPRFSNAVSALDIDPGASGSYCSAVTLSAYLNKY